MWPGICCPIWGAICGTWSCCACIVAFVPHDAMAFCCMACICRACCCRACCNCGVGILSRKRSLAHVMESYECFLFKASDFMEHQHFSILVRVQNKELRKIVVPFLGFEISFFGDNKIIYFHTLSECSEYSSSSYKLVIRCPVKWYFGIRKLVPNHTQLDSGRYGKSSTEPAPSPWEVWYELESNWAKYGQEMLLRKWGLEIEDPKINRLYDIVDDLCEGNAKTMRHTAEQFFGDAAEGL